MVRQELFSSTKEFFSPTFPRTGVSEMQKLQRCSIYCGAEHCKLHAIYVNLKVLPLRRNVFLEESDKFRSVNCMLFI